MLRRHLRGLHLMRLNHVANRLTAEHFETVVAMLRSRLGFVELRRTERSVWLRQSGTDVDLQFSRSTTDHRDADKLRSQVAFLSETPEHALEGLASWARAHGLVATVGSYSSTEFYLDAPLAKATSANKCIGTPTKVPP